MEPMSKMEPSTHFAYSNVVYYEGEGDNADFYSALTVMPLRSDGSLCMMDAMNNSQLQGTPKLENFFGETTMGCNHYEGRDNMYYHQDMNFEPNSQDFLNIVQSNSRDQQQQYPECSSLKSHELYQRSHQIKETHLTKDNVQHPQRTDNNNTNCLKDWVPMTYYMDTAMEERMMGWFHENGVESGSLGAMANGDLQSLSLSMSPGSQSSCISGSQLLSPAMAECMAIETKKRGPEMAECMAIETKKRGPEKVENKQIVQRKSIDTFGQRTSQYRGVTRHRWTGRYEAHLWDNSCKKEGQSKKGRQVYLGGYDMEEKAARAYDLAALKYWGPSTHTNFQSETYRQELEEMKNMNRQEYVAHLRRKSSGFSRGASIYRGVTRHHQHGRWQARIGRVAGNKDLYLGTFSTQEEAAEAYDIAAIKFRGVNSVTNFDISKYDVGRIMASNTLLARELARRSKNSQPNDAVSIGNTHDPNFSTEDSNVGIHQFSQECHKPRGLDFKNSSFFSVARNDLIVAQMPNADKLSNLPVHLAASMPDSSNPVVNSWISSNQLRSHAPVFAAWTDAS